MKIKFELPVYVQKVARILIKEGYKCYLVGGVVRDLVLDRQANDWDLATDAKPDEMQELFPKSVATGARFGMISAIVPDANGENHEVEVTTFRNEAQYTDGRWPTKVEFIDEIFEDLGRRDFTINAMAIDLAQDDLSGKLEMDEWTIYDPFGGLEHLDEKLIAAVGTAKERMKEDGLRGFRACRFASQLGFEIEPETMDAIKETLAVAKMVSMERVRDEFMKLLTKSPKPSYGVELLRESGLLEIFIPELLEGVDVEQKKFHAFDVYKHSLAALDAAPDRIKLAALFHDIGKPRKDTKDGHFYGHDLEGAEMSKKIMKRMKFSNADIDKVYKLVRNHMFYYPTITDETSEEEAKEIERHKWSDAAVRRFIARVGEENIDELFELRIADAAGNPMASFQPDEIEALEQRIAEIREQDMALSVQDLDITGNDLIELGVEEGPKIGEIMNQLLDEVLENPNLNEKGKLVGLVEEKYIYDK